MSWRELKLILVLFALVAGFRLKFVVFTEKKSVDLRLSNSRFFSCHETKPRVVKSRP